MFSPQVPGAYFILDKNNGRVRLVYQNIISTWAGNGLPGQYFGDKGLSLLAAFNRPSGIAVDATGNVYIGDSANDVVRVARIFYQSPPTPTPTLKPSSAPTAAPSPATFAYAQYTIMVGSPVDNFPNIGLCNFNGLPNPACNLRSAWETCVRNIPLNPCPPKGLKTLFINCKIMLSSGMPPHILDSQFGTVFNSDPLIGWASACLYTQLTISIAGNVSAVNNIVIMGDGTPETQLIKIQNIPFLSLAFSNMTIGGFANSTFDLTGLKSTTFTNVIWNAPVAGGMVYTSNKGTNYRGVAVTLEGMKQVKFYRCLFDGLINTGKWGAVYIEQSSVVSFTECIFRNNVANVISPSSTGEGVGGAGVSILSSSMLSFLGCSFINNTVLANDNWMNTNGGGGAIFALSSSTITISQCHFINNVVDLVTLNGTTTTIASIGGAVCLQYTSNVTITHTSFVNNKATSQGMGGAIYALGPAHSLVIDSSRFQGNTVPGYVSQRATTSDRYCWGGALFLNAITNVVITASNFDHNNAGGLVGLGGTLYATKLNNFIFSNNTVSGDGSGDAGGSMYFLADSIYLSIKGCTLRNTLSLRGHGGAIYFGTNISYVNIAGTQIVNAIAGGNGGAIYIGSTCSLFSFGGLQPVYFDSGSQSALTSSGNVDATTLVYNLEQGPITGFFVAFDGTTASSLSCDDGVQVGTYVGGNKNPNCHSEGGWDSSVVPGVLGIAPAYSPGEFLSSIYLYSIYPYSIYYPN